MPRTKSPSPVIPVPQTRDEAADYMRQIGVHQRLLAGIEVDMNARIAGAKDLAEKEASVPRAQIALLTAGLKTWCDANRAVLTDDGRTKTVDLGTGKVSWRLQPAKVVVKGVEAVLAELKRLKYRKFIRVKEEIDKEAILAAAPALRDRLAAIPGLTIGSEGEAFACEPFETALLGAPAVEAEAA